ncbi:MAG: hypothetical protein RBS77_00620 [Candidatus Moranbacteria bacterium]|jgi:hypothetical protein|nr:hypothetical protein [Candidatus Moranbacteria bacterium]
MMGEFFIKRDENNKRVCPMCKCLVDEDYPLEYCEGCIRDIDEAELDEYES